MKAQSLWRGTDYAHGYRAKGGPLPLDATRVKVLEIIKEPIYGKARFRTYVRIQYLNDDGTPNEKYNGSTPKVVAREILDFWDEYIETVREDREERQRQREEYQRREEERRVKREQEHVVYYIGQFLRRSWQKELTRRAEEAARIEREEKEKRTTRMKRVLIGRGLKADRVSILENRDTVGLDSYVVIDLEEMERWLGFDK